MVPRIVTHDHDQKRRLLIFYAMQMCLILIIGDETWCLQCDPETKRQSIQWKTQNSPRSKKLCMSRSQVKNMLVCFFDHKGTVHYEFTAKGQTVNKQCYLEVMIRLRESVAEERIRTLV